MVSYNGFYVTYVNICVTLICFDLLEYILSTFQVWQKFSHFYCSFIGGDRIEKICKLKPNILTHLKQAMWVFVIIWHPSSIHTCVNFTLKSSPLKELCQIEPNLEGDHLWYFFTKLAHFVPIQQRAWLSWMNLVFDWLKHKKIFPSETTWPNGTICYIYASSLTKKLQNLEGSIYGRSFTKFSHFVQIQQKHCLHGWFLFLIG